MSKFSLVSYLAPFNSIEWYTCAGQDLEAATRFGVLNSNAFEIMDSHDYPDCIIFTDYTNIFYTDSERLNNLKSCRDFDFYSKDRNTKYEIFNIKYFKKALTKPALFESEYISSSCYGDVYTFDMQIYSNKGIFQIKCIYANVEALSLALHYFIPNQIEIKHIITYHQGYGFGGGTINLNCICNLFKDLKTKYYYTDELLDEVFVNGENVKYDYDSGRPYISEYLTIKQKAYNPNYKLAHSKPDINIYRIL